MILLRPRKCFKPSNTNITDVLLKGVDQSRELNQTVLINIIVFIFIIRV